MFESYASLRMQANAFKIDYLFAYNAERILSQIADCRKFN